MDDGVHPGRDRAEDRPRRCRMKKMPNKDKIKSMVTEAIDGVFTALVKDLGLRSGDWEPGQAVTMDHAVDMIADLIEQWFDANDPRAELVAALVKAKREAEALGETGLAADLQTLENRITRCP